MTDIEEQVKHFRENETPESRSLDAKFTIDPGFVHQRKIQTILGSKGTSIINDLVKKIPSNLPLGLKTGQIDHIYKNVFLYWCKTNGIKTFEEIYATKKGRIFCSVEQLNKCEEIYDSKRVKVKLITRKVIPEDIFLEFTSSRVTSDTIRSRLVEGDIFAIIAELKSYTNVEIIFDPIIIGSPWFENKEIDSTFDLSWYGYIYYENFIEDFKEFSKVTSIPLVSINEIEILKSIPEKKIKQVFAELLGESPKNDWGGEQSDLFSSQIHLGYKRLTAAFLLKGPANFKPMSLNNLGKNNDQIVRLANEPADVLFIQHCHEILPAVRSTLRAFAVQPGNPRRYCLIDGRDTLRILKAYDKL